MLDQIIIVIENAYKIKVTNTRLLRESIGFVYLVKTIQGDYVFKLYRKNTHIDVKSVIGIMSYLNENHINVPKIKLTKEGYQQTQVNQQIGILFEYINGVHVSKKKHKKQIIDTYHKLQNAMARYPGIVPEKDVCFYIDRYLSHLETIDYDQSKIGDLKRIGDDLYDYVHKLKHGFFHGDFHSENMLIDASNNIYLLDFDACAKLASCLDLVVFFDQTHFNQFDSRDFYKTMNSFKDISVFDDLSLKSLMAFIAVRHYEIIATIISERNLKYKDFSFYNQQYQWIKSFYQLWSVI